jgi:hypothetical protein
MIKTGLPLARAKTPFTNTKIKSYFTSLCAVCFRHVLQNFFVSNRSVCFFLFFDVV